MKSVSGEKGGLLMWTGKNKRWYSQHRFCFLVVCIRFGLFFFPPRVSEALVPQSIAAEHTRGVIVTEIHQTLHVLPHEACFLCAVPRCVQIFPGCLPLWFDIRYSWIRSTAWSPPKWCHWAWSNFVVRWLNHTFSFNSRVIKWTERLCELLRRRLEFAFGHSSHIWFIWISLY